MWFVVTSGVVAGALHVVAGPDHLAAVAPLAADGRRRLWRSGLLWGLGHTGGVVAVGLLALLPLTSLTVARAQTLSLPLLAGFVWVLSEHARSSSRAVWWLVPGAALWGKLHGSALLAPALTGVSRRGAPPRPSRST